MSSGGRNALAARSHGGGTDGSDFSHRQRVEPKYQALADYKQQLVLLFNYTPYFYAISILLLALHFHTSLKPITLTFLPNFWLTTGLLIAAAAASLQSFRLQSNVAFMVLAIMGTVFMIYLTVVYSFQCAFPDVSKNEQKGFVWYLVGAIINGLIVLLNSYGIFTEYMIIQLYKSKRQ